ncbi:glycosyltransferase family 4 protein [Patiriisocius sp. Uisw_017]|jgi:hypothetical protein|uniref:glycosyltransferase family 4 protein n=1 Tax=Patiriisocius sp. Uisw_017 TaxID=3230968 RepID=UPI0039E92021
MKKVLIICYYWPPAGGPGVQRWLKFAAYLREFGVEPILFVPENPEYPIIDNDIVNEVPLDLTILKLPIKEPYRFAKLLSSKKTKRISSGIISNKKSSIIEKILLYIRGNFFIPDARIGWVKPAIKFLTNYLEHNKIDVIISSGPPHSLHLIGLGVKEKHTIPWIADFRDPWTTIHYHSSLKLSEKSEARHKRLERIVLNEADEIIVTSPSTKIEFKAITNKPITVITNGFEPKEGIQRVLDTKFTIVHTGSILSERNPVILWRVLSELVAENAVFKNDLKIIFAGAVSEVVIKNIKEIDLTENLEMKGYVNHQEAIQLQHNAQVLLLLEIDRPETRAIIPGKLFEYLKAKRPILALGPDGSDIEAILTETNTGDYIPITLEGKIRDVILQHYKSYKSGTLEVASKGISKYSRKSLTKELSEVIFRNL